MKKILRSIAALLCGTALLVSVAVAAPPTGGFGPGGMGDMGGAPGFNLEDFIMGGGTSGPVKVYDASADFIDYAEIVNKDAVTILSDLGLFNGVEAPDGKLAFDPDGILTRGALAKLMALAATLVSGETPDGETKFADTAGHWAEGYIAYCADKGLMTGQADGTFAPNMQVTVADMEKVLQSAIGGKEADLLAGITAVKGAVITRDNAAQMLLNAMCASDGTAVFSKVTVVTEGTYNTLTIGENELLVSAEGGITLSVDGIGVAQEKGKTYTDVTVTITDKNLIKYSSSYTYNYRQGIYAGKDGYNENKSVTAVTAGTVGMSSASDVVINSDEESFNGIYVDGGTYTVNGADITLNGNGGNDFAGYGAAVMASGDDTVLVVDGANISTDGAVRTTAVVDKGATLIVKNSTLTAQDGELPADYVMTIQPGDMKESPWMLGIRGNNRATNLLGTNSIAAYINSKLSAENWGVLSSDNCTTGNIVTINSDLSITGDRGAYVNLVIGSTVGTFLGSTLNSTDYASYIMGGDIIYGDSTVEAITELNDRLGLMLTEEEIAGLSQKGTVINAGRNAILQAGAGDVTITGKATITTGETTFLIKGARSNILVDGSEGATITTKNGVILQLMDSDDPGAITGAYTEPAGPVEKDTVHDVTVMDNDVVATFIDMDLEGDFYNSTRGGQSGATMFSDGDNSKNLKVVLDGTTLKGVVSSSTAKHNASTINVDNYWELGRVNNTIAPAVNNGALVELVNGSAWTVTGNCYLTGLSVSADSSVSAANGMTLTMIVNGVITDLVPGQSYTGSIILIAG